MKETFYSTGRIFLLLVLTTLLSSHELFLKTDSYFLKEKQAAQVYLFNGTFDNSENAITTDRITGTRIVGTDYDYDPVERDYNIEGNVTYLSFTTGASGTYVAGISTLPRMIELEAPDFHEYLEHEGLDKVISEREEQGISDQLAREKYSKHVKALLQVGSIKSDHYKMELGYPIEFIPLENPYILKVGDKMRFRLLLGGKPLKDQGVHISSRPDGPDPFADEVGSQTDENGEFSFEITEAGHWYVATVHMVQSQEEDIDYESNWATLTFEIAAN